MSTRELARTLLDEMPDNDLIYLVAYMQSLKALKDAEIPNAETLEAFEELDNGGGHTYTGPVENLISSLLEDESA